jgi:hypothetical protein
MENNDKEETQQIQQPHPITIRMADNSVIVMEVNSGKLIRIDEPITE